MILSFDRCLWFVLVFLCISFPAHSAISAANSEHFKERKEWLIQQGVISKEQSPEFVNSLITSKSPYLLSHSLQPVDWLEWSDTTQQLAKQKQQLIYLSIGYSTCHWCHVMAKESFADQRTAEILNESYISVKVDREQLPAIDYQFRRALENLQGEAGWPINVILTPDQHIVWIDSYLPKEKFHDVLIKLANKWSKSPAQLQIVAAQFHTSLLPKTTTTQAIPTTTQIKTTYQDLQQNIVTLFQQENNHNEPNFLREHWMLESLKYAAANGDQNILAQILRRIDDILSSPTWDPVEGGFHRYSTSGGWEQPHFEKMLYNQAQMISVLTLAYLLSANEKYISAADRTISWIESTLELTHGGYASALSAFSAQGEGDYYRIPQTLLEQLAGQPDYSLIEDQTEYGLVTSPLNRQARQTLKQFRQNKPLPYRDDKLIVSWNAMLLIALIDIYEATESKKYKKLAISLGDLLWQQAWQDKQLFRVVFEGKTSTFASTDDYAWLGMAYARGGAALTKTDWLDRALILSQHINSHDATELQFQDGETPAPGALALFFLNTLKDLTNNPELSDGEQSLIKSGFAQAKSHPLSYAALINTIAAVQQGTPTLKKRVAKGHGVADAYWSKTNEIIVNISLEKGWHVNANPAGSTRLIPVQAELLPNQEAFSAHYPTPVYSEFGFIKEILPVYEGDISIVLSFDRPKVRSIIKLKIQACSDNLCLLPETHLIIPRPLKISDLLSHQD